MKNKREDRFEAIVDQFVKNDLIAQEEYSYYLYGVKHLEVLIMTTGGVLLSGILLKEILFTVVFLITFSLLRIGWQGIHAKTKIRCFCYIAGYRRFADIVSDFDGTVGKRKR